MENQKCDNLFKARVLYSVLSTSVLQILFLFVTSCLAYFEPIQPFGWIFVAVEKIVSLRMWCILIAFGILVSVQCFLYSQNFVAENKIASCRFSQLKILFSPNYLLLLILHMFLWGIISLLFMELFEISLGNDSRKCVNEKRIVMLASGVFFGTYFLISDCRNIQKPSPRYLQFPAIHQLKFLQVKMSLFSTSKQCLVDAVPPTLIFIVFYLWKGNTLVEILYEYHGFVNDSSCRKTYNSVWSLGTIFQVWFFFSLSFNIVCWMKLLFRIYLTEYFSFLVTAPFGSSVCMTLHEALSSSNAVVMQLGYLDLKILSEKDSARRDELFTLSQLGGHPLNWNAVVETSLKMIRDFSEKLKTAISDKPIIAASTTNKTGSEEIGSKFEVSSPYKTALRNLSPGRFEPITLNPLDVTVLAPAGEELMFDIIVRKVKGVATHLLDKPGFRYFFCDLTELNVHHVMSQAQMVAWAVDGLSVLAATSIVLDKYGVALKDLPALITSLLDLKQVLDMLHKMSTFKKELRSYEADVKMRRSLQAAVKRSLYRVTIAFQNHVDELPVTNGVRNKLKPFVLFKEG